MDGKEMAKYPLKSFRPNQKVLEIMEDIEYGERSKWVNKCCEMHGTEAKIKLEKEQNFQGNSNGSEDSSTSREASSEPPKPSDGAEATTQENSADSVWSLFGTSDRTRSWKDFEEKP